MGMGAPPEQARTLDWARMRDLLLVAEILSPSSARYDRFIKRRRYQEAELPLYWIVDAEERRVEIWKPADTLPRLEHQVLIWQPEGRPRYSPSRFPSCSGLSRRMCVTASPQPSRATAEVHWTNAA